MSPSNYSLDLWTAHKDLYQYLQTVANVGKPRERWIWDKTWQAIDEKKTKKMKKEQLSFTEEDYAQLMAEYNANAKEDKKLHKEDKALWIESKL